MVACLCFALIHFFSSGFVSLGNRCLRSAVLATTLGRGERGTTRPSYKTAG